MSFVKVSDEANRDYGEFVERTSGFNVSGRQAVLEQLSGIRLHAHDCYSIMRFPEVYYIMLEVVSLIVMLGLTSKALRFVMENLYGVWRI